MRDMASETAQLDPKSLQTAYTDGPAPNRSSYSERPAAATVEHLDAANHEVLIELKEFAKGRHDPKSALTWKRYTASYGSVHTVRGVPLVGRLLQQEHNRLGPVAAAPTEGKDKK